MKMEFMIQQIGLVRRYQYSISVAEYFLHDIDKQHLCLGGTKIMGLKQGI